jgi:hypothetical protein
MSGEAWLYLLAVLINAVNLFLQVFFTIMYSDLEWSVLTRLIVDRAYPTMEIRFSDGWLPDDPHPNINSKRTNIGQ